MGMNEMLLHQQLAEKLHEPTIRKSKKWKAYSSFKGNIWVPADIQLILVNRIKYFDFNYLLLIVLVIMFWFFI